MDKINDFVNVTRASFEDARIYLERANGDLQLAISMYLTEKPAFVDNYSKPHGSTTGFTSSTKSNSNIGHSTHITSHGNAQSLRNNSSTRSSFNRTPRRKIATLNDINSDDSVTNPLGHRNDDPQHLFTGGEKSGLAVTPQDHSDGFGGRASEPTCLVDQIVKKAQQSMISGQRSSEFDQTPARSQQPSFSGRGIRLGSEDSLNHSVTDDETGSDSENHHLPLLQRILHFWRDGFSIDDGPLYRFDDPANDAYLQAINMGRAPIALLNVKPRQAVDVQIIQHSSDFVKPSPSLDNSGPGHRLGTGSLNTFLQSSESSSNNNEASNNIVTPTSSLGIEGDTAVQIRFADGSTQRARFDSQGPVQQLYDYVNSISLTDRQYVLQLPMPVKVLDDKEESLESVGAAGAVIVQRWV